jgi:predicted NAD/FAD-binding protein
VERTSDRVTIRDESDQVHHVDRVVIATHPDEALALLANPSTAEQDVLGAFRYSRNETWLHTDSSVLPRKAKASWNYLKTSCQDTGGPVLVSYDMNRLMRLTEPLDYVVTLNATDRVREDAVIAKMVYSHPVYTPESVAAQRRLPSLNTGTVAYAGAYHGWGFHEDGCASGVRAAAALGVTW